MLTDDLTTTHVLDAPTLTHRRIGGGLLLAHVALMLAGFTLEVSPMHGDSPQRASTLFAEAPFDRVIAGGYVESLAFVVLLPGLVLLARAIGRRTETGRWAATTGLAAGISYVAVTLAAGMPAGAAALYGAQHGASATTVMAVNDIRNYAFFLSILLAGAMAVAVGVAALSDKVHTWWLGYGGVLAGAAAVAAVGAGAPNLGSMIWLVWFVGVGVLLVRGPRRAPSA